MFKFTQLSSLILSITFLFLSACKPIEAPGIKNDLADIEARCIASQSQCEIGHVPSTFSVKFAQHQLTDKVKTELPVYIELTQLLTSNALAEKTTEQGGHSAQVTKLSAYLEGRDMFMGKVPVFFEQQDNEKYVAETLLANCTEEEMVWRLWVMFELDGQAKKYFVDFTSQRL